MLVADHPTARCPARCPTSPANRDYQPGFAAALMLKDLKLSQEAAQSAGAVTPLGAEATQLYALFNAQGNSGVGLFRHYPIPARRRRVDSWSHVSFRDRLYQKKPQI